MKNIFVLRKKRTLLKLPSLVCFSLAVFLLMGPFTALADNVILDPITFTSMAQQGTAEHDDLGLPVEEAKGSMMLTVTNSTGVDWGDFHFEITFGDAIFDPAETPTWDHAGTLNWELSAGNTILDLTFYNSPVLVNETVTFTVWTNNQATQALFGVCFYPTPVPVPIPAACWLLGAAFIGLLGIRKRFP